MSKLEDGIRQTSFPSTVLGKSQIGSLGVSAARGHLLKGEGRQVISTYSALYLHGSPGRLALEVEGKERPLHEALPGEITVRGAGVRCEGRVLAPNDFTVFEMPTTLVRKVLGDPKADFADALASVEFRPITSILLSQLVRDLDRVLFESGVSTPIATETLYQTICLELWRLVKRDVQPVDANARPMRLSASVLRDINDYVDATCAQQVDLDALSRLTSLKHSSISQAFKNTVGQTPYQYILTRRIARARFLVETSKLPLREVAERCGFVSQSHLTTTFRDKVGLTPASLREIVQS
ncbi:helix-turn-helix transcriptional regulator [Ruegeria profundi]|uniref:helix-turn-helix transcriptional regulator n=1 Tax=Ruegeria profundi TaxID=1685378 RepID=UPI001969EB17|nr:AraC family transcriptional regulator [Ruegeria profundi]